MADLEVFGCVLQSLVTLKVLGPCDLRLQGPDVEQHAASLERGRHLRYKGGADKALLQKSQTTQT